MPRPRPARRGWRSAPAQPAHDVAVVLGSGWAAAADALGTGPEVPLADLGGFPPPTVPGHVPVVRSVPSAGLRVLVFLGRTHLYEGHPVPPVVHGVRTAVAAGCRVIVLTNAAGGIRDGLPGRAAGADQRPPQPDRPLAADRDRRRPPGTRPGSPTSPTCTRERLRGLARAADPGLAEGVYAALPGPHYETPAEIRMLRDARRRPGRHVHRAGGDRSTPPGRRGAGDLAGHQPGGRVWRRRRSTTPRSPPPAQRRRGAGWARCWPAWSCPGYGLT